MLSSCLTMLYSCSSFNALPGSPGFSMVVCIYYEHQFRCSIYDHLAFMFFFRYFDDLRAVVVHQSSDITTKNLAMSLLYKLQNQTYHPSMSLFLEEFECLQNTFEFLEGEFTIQNDSLSCLWSSKNFESLQKHGKMKFFSSQDYFSYTGDKRKIVRHASIIGKLATLYCFTDQDLLHSFGFLLVDLFTRNSPKKVSQHTSILVYIHKLLTNKYY